MLQNVSISQIFGKITPQKWNVQLLQIAVGNVMAAPVRHSIELDAVRELHLVLVVKPLSLLCPLGLSLQIPRVSLLALFYALVVGKLELFGICRLCVGCSNTPSSLQPCRGAVRRVVWPRRTGTVCRGGIRGGDKGVYGEE
jgi:hypothetical protein